ncbi:MAG: prolipoprotein diacylglyceryl transferase, partial [Nanoarchaeota archaeon]|nr:prolipoprotein diacylglyceryl transferase [Nanoarchaeota archaeon]MBU1945570.1 prolipoprotein diacylglyceryl transferase [Nanoarchaeota archaeon]
YFFVYHLAKKRNLNLTKDDVADFIFYLIIGTVIGARLFEIIFYEPAYYFANPLEMIAVWHGGLSFHGGLVGAVLACYLYSRKKKVHFYDLADIVSIPLAFALFLGRIANFINGELVGRLTTLPWCVKFMNYEGCRHPSQLYESLKNLVLFSILWSIKDKKLKKGIMFWSFVLLYSTLRFFIEFVKDPGDIGFILGLTMGQLLCIAMFAIGLFFFVKINRQKHL